MVVISLLSRLIRHLLRRKISYFVVLSVILITFRSSNMTLNMVLLAALASIVLPLFLLEWKLLKLNRTALGNMTLMPLTVFLFNADAVIDVLLQFSLIDYVQGDTQVYLLTEAFRMAINYELDTAAMYLSWGLAFALFINLNSSKAIIQYLTKKHGQYVWVHNFDESFGIIELGFLALLFKGRTFRELRNIYKNKLSIVIISEETLQVQSVWFEDITTFESWLLDEADSKKTCSLCNSDDLCKEIDGLSSSENKKLTTLQTCDQCLNQVIKTSINGGLISKSSVVAKTI